MDGENLERIKAGFGNLCVKSWRKRGNTKVLICCESFYILNQNSICGSGVADGHTEVPEGIHKFRDYSDPDVRRFPVRIFPGKKTSDGRLLTNY